MSTLVRVIEVETPAGPVLYAASSFRSVEDSDRFGATVQQTGVGVDQGAALLVDAGSLLEELLAGDTDVYAA